MMYVAEVAGTIVATRKSSGLVGMKLLLVRRLEMRNDDDKKAPVEVAVDSVGAGVGERVLVVTGTAARLALPRQDVPVDGVIVGIVDSVDLREP